MKQPGSGYWAWIRNDGGVIQEPAIVEDGGSEELRYNVEWERRVRTASISTLLRRQHEKAILVPLPPDSPWPADDNEP
jgi:hypothetical protein